MYGGADFGQALTWLREGFQVFRDSWYGDRFVVLQEGYPKGIGINANTAKATGLPEGTICRFEPYLMIGVADGTSPSGTTFRPWEPTAQDVLAEDWKIC